MLYKIFFIINKIWLKSLMKAFQCIALEYRLNIYKKKKVSKKIKNRKKKIKKRNIEIKKRIAINICL